MFETSLAPFIQKDVVIQEEFKPLLGLDLSLGRAEKIWPLFQKWF